MKRLSLSDLKAKQAELAKKIAAAEEREQLSIGSYMQSLTGESELVGVKRWLEENAFLADNSKELKISNGDRKTCETSAMTI